MQFDSGAAKLTNLSFDYWMEICQYLAPPDVFRVSQINQSFYNDFLFFKDDRIDDQQQSENNSESILIFDQLQETVVYHLENEINTSMLTLEEMKIFEKMKRKSISSRGELRECIRLYLKFNYILITNKEVAEHCEFIIKFTKFEMMNRKVEVKLPKSRRFKSIKKELLRYILDNDIQLREDDVLAVHGYKKRGHIQIFDVYKIEFPMKESIYHLDIKRLNGGNSQLLYSNIIHKYFPGRQETLQKLIIQQEIDITKRDITVILDRAGSIPRNILYTTAELIDREIMVHIKNNPFTITPEISTEILYSPPIISELLNSIQIIFGSTLFAYTSIRVFGFLIFYHVYSLIKLLTNTEYFPNNLAKQVLFFIAFFVIYLAASLGANYLLSLIHRQIIAKTGNKKVQTLILWIYFLVKAAMYLMGVKFGSSDSIFYQSLLAITEFNHNLIFIVVMDVGYGIINQFKRLKMWLNCWKTNPRSHLKAIHSRLLNWFK